MYSESQRNIFGPIDRGDGQPVYVDPLAARRAFEEALDGDPLSVIETYNGQGEGVTPLARLQAEGKLIRAIRLALGLIDFDPLDPNFGVTDETAFGYLRDFLEYLEKNALGARS